MREECSVIIGHFLSESGKEQWEDWSFPTQQSLGAIRNAV